MKSNVVLTVFLMNLLFSLAQAGQESLLTDAESQKKYERKVQLQLGDMGLISRHVNFPVFFCIEKKEKSADKQLAKAILGKLAGNCIPVGKWEFTISPSLESRIAATVFDRLAGKRYDVLRLKSGKLSLKTLRETIEVDIESDSEIAAFSFETGNFAEFKSSVDGYLNKNIAPLMTKLLSKAKDARYQEMADKERETFLATAAKEYSVPANFIAKLMNSAFVFAVHGENPKGSVTISQTTVNHHLEFSTNVSVDLSTNLAIFRFNPDVGKFEFYKRVSESSGRVSASDHVYTFRPKTADAINDPFEKSYIVAAKAAGIASNVALKEDDNFAIFSTVDEIDGNRFISVIGENEDLRIDAPYKIYQYIDGKKTEMGWGKARKVAGAETYLNKNADYRSEFDLIGGDMEIKDQLREHPWTGMFWYLGYANSTITLTEFDGASASGGGDYAGLNLGAKLDLGYVFNAPSQSEKWLEFTVNLGSGGSDLQTETLGTFENTSALTVSADLVQRKYLGASSTYFGYKYGLGFYSLSGTEVVSSKNLSISSAGLNLGLQAGYSRTPNNTFYINLDYLLPILSNASYGDQNNSVDYEAVLSPAINLTIGATFHLRSTGPLSVFMR